MHISKHKTGQKTEDKDKIHKGREHSLSDFKIIKRLIVANNEIDN